MEKRIVKLDENKLEALVKKIIKEEESVEKKEKTSTLTRHPAYPIIDNLEDELDRLKSQFRREIANKVSGEDGYHSEIDKFNSEFNKFVTKVSDLKGKINDFTIERKDRKTMEEKKAMMEKKKMDYMKKEEARKQGKRYSY